jgi:hypothetical protein
MSALKIIQKLHKEEIADKKYRVLNKKESKIVRDYYKELYSSIPDKKKVVGIFVESLDDKNDRKNMCENEEKKRVDKNTSNKYIRISNGYTRLVIGDHPDRRDGANIEMDRKQMNLDVLEIPDGQMFRKGLLDNNRETKFLLKDNLLNGSNHILMKYVWLQPKNSTTKIYLQARPVKYADYKVDMFYVDPELVTFMGML